MSLHAVPGDIQGVTGSTETIQIVPETLGSVMNIVSVLYGTDANGPISVPVNPDGLSFSIKLVTGSNLLQVVIFSPTSTRQTAIVQQPGTANPLAEVDVVSGMGVWSPEVVAA